jgi:predicted PurR-regulated permease PerM
LFIPLIRTEIDVIGSLNALQVEQQLRSQFPNLAAGLDSMGYGQGAFATTLMDTQSHLSFSGISSWFGDIIGWITGFVGGVFSVIFMSFFFLKDEDLFARILEAITPDVHLSKVNNIVLHTKKTLSRYFGGLLIQTAIMGLMVGSGLYFTGVPNAGLFGLVSALLNVVPYIGPAMAYLLTLVMGVSTQIAFDPNADMGHIVSMTTLIFAIAQLLDAILIQPYIVGSSIRVHPLELFIVLMAAASVGGIPAMGIALPAYAILRIAAREWLTEYKWVKQLTKNL